MSFDSVVGAPRNHQDFSNFAYMRTHQRSRSPFVGCPFINDMIWSFPIDCMHCIDLGVAKKMLDIFIKHNFIDLASSTRIIRELSKYIPSDFSRKMRPFDKLNKFKATELRQFCLYLGPVLLKQCGLAADKYSNFMLLFVAYRLLSGVNNEVSPNDLHIAEEFLKTFVKDFKKLYGQVNVVPNVHALLHLHEFVRRYGPLNGFAAYKFENFYRLVADNWIRKGSDFFSQVYTRWFQNKGVVLSTQKSKFESYILNNGMKDSCIMLTDSSVFIIKEKKLTLTGMQFKGLRYRLLQNFFDVPMPSSALDIFQVSELSTELEVINIQNLKSKMFRMPYEQDFVVMPIIHY